MASPQKTKTIKRRNAITSLQEMRRNAITSLQEMRRNTITSLQEMRRNTITSLQEMRRNAITSLRKMKELYQNKYRVQTTRVTWHSYNYGVYFVTICVQDRSYCFGHMADDKPQMQYAPLGEYVRACLERIEQIYAGVRVVTYQVMPNHVHLLIDCRAIQDDAIGTRSVLAKIVGSTKQTITRYAKKNGIPFAWQERYYDHIVRSDEQLGNIARYIEDNPLRWQFDKFNAANQEKEYDTHDPFVQ